MKKEQKKKQEQRRRQEQRQRREQKNQSRSRANSDRSYNTDTSFLDFGLEPPKIYREPQQTRAERPKRNPGDRTPARRKRTVSRKEKRAQETKRRKARYLFRKIVIWLLVIAFVGAVGTVLSLTVFFNISKITVEGSKMYSEKDILAQCTINEGENLFLANTKLASEKLEQALPYIYKAEIRRRLPDTINIKITQATPTYSVKTGEKAYIYLDNNFKVLETDMQSAKGIVISKAEIHNAVPGYKIGFKNEDISDCLGQIATVIKNNKFNEITSIYSNNSLDNYVVYDKRITFKLGECEDIERKIYQGMAACGQLDAKNPNVRGTLTVTGGKSVYFTEETA